MSGGSGPAAATVKNGGAGDGGGGVAKGSSIDRRSAIGPVTAQATAVGMDLSCTRTQDADWAATLQVNACAAGATAAVMRTDHSKKLAGQSQWHRMRTSVGARSWHLSRSSAITKGSDADGAQSMCRRRQRQQQ